MAEELMTKADGEQVQLVKGTDKPGPGSVGLETQLPGKSTTVSQVADSTGGIEAGNLIVPDIDDKLFEFNSDDTPLMNLMLKAKKVKVKSPVVMHYMIDEPRSSVFTTVAYTATKALQAVLTMAPEDQELLRPHTTLLVKGVNGYDANGVETPGQELMLFVTGHDTTTNNPVVRPVNGVKSNSSDEYSTMPNIPAGTELVILGNALYETQKEVDPDLIVPQPTEVYLQKRGLNQVVSDYFEAQAKQIPFSQAVIAEKAIKNFKVRGNRTLWAGRKGRLSVDVPKMGKQYIYFTEGVRWHFKRELQHVGKWTVEKFIALAKMFYTGEDVPKTGLILAGNNFLENIQNIDFSSHPEITINSKTSPIGWEVTNIHTVYGDFMIKREPTLDKLGWSNSAALIGEDRIVHYVYSAEHSFNDRVDGQEATRKGILTWDALALKGSCHIWIDGEGDAATPGATSFIMWDSTEAPTDMVDGAVYYLLQNCPGIDKTAVAGETWQYKGEKWSEYKGMIYAA
ncbi:MAG: hypothetical protein IJB60_09255 [Bacteroidaceae bacterium]|nr:hypothetical protein [Bacteroidaceae bacterium]MBQ3189596.1 hypothetical protein [Bacteroidaceae bacterium]